MDKQRYMVIPRTLCFVFNDQDEILFIERSSTKFDAGMMNGLGGHIEKGEDIIMSAERERFEESGIKPESTEIMGIIHDTNLFGKDIIVFVTKSTTTQKDLIDSDEGSLKWVKINEIDKLNTYADIKQFIDLIKLNKKFTGTSLFNGESKLIEMKLRDL